MNEDTENPTGENTENSTTEAGSHAGGGSDAAEAPAAEEQSEALVEQFRRQAGIGTPDSDPGNDTGPDDSPGPRGVTEAELKGEMAEAPEHVQQKHPSDITKEDLEWLDEDRREEVLEILALREDPDESVSDSVDEGIDAPPADVEVRESAAQAVQDQDVSASSPASTATVSTAAESPSNESGSEGGENSANGTTDENTTTTTTSTGADTSTGGSETEDEEMDPATLSETGLVDEEGDFPWEGAEETDLGDIQETTVTVKGTTFELTEPEDSQALENAARHLQGAEDAPEDERQEAARKYQRELAEAVMTHDGLSLDQLYIFKTPEDKPNRLVNTRDHSGCASHEQTKPFWDALTVMDRSKLGARASNFIEGQGRFRT